MREKLRSEEGKEKYKKRRETVEPVFGNIKYNKNLSEFLVRGIKKCKIEYLLSCAGHNIDKIVEKVKEKGKKLAKLVEKESNKEAIGPA